MDKNAKRIGRPKNDPGTVGWCGDALRMQRARMRWTLDDLAERLGVSTSTVSRWENEATLPTSKQVGEIARALGVARKILGKKSRKGVRSRSRAR